MMNNAETPLVVYWDEIFTAHEAKRPPIEGLVVQPPHPDDPGRVTNIQECIETSFSGETQWKPVSPATDEAITSVHASAHLEHLDELSSRRTGSTEAIQLGIGPKTASAARHAAGAAIEAAMNSVQGETIPYALVRPSGHHAQSDQIEGFCYLNNVAIAAKKLLTTDKVESVAIIDWDVHHGNGTQEIFYDNSEVLYLSVHGDHRSWGMYHPQTGRPTEYGTGSGEGYTVNVPLPPGAGIQSYEYACNHILEPILDQYDPDAVLVSAGQDGGHVDSLGRHTLTVPGFYKLGRRVRHIATRHADGRLAIVQEGGYHLGHLPFATLGILEGACGIENKTQEPYPPAEPETLDEAIRYVHQAGVVHTQFWELPFVATE